MNTNKALRYTKVSATKNKQTTAKRKQRDALGPMWPPSADSSTTHHLNKAWYSVEMDCMEVTKVTFLKNDDKSTTCPFVRVHQTDMHIHTHSRFRKSPGVISYHGLVGLQVTSFLSSQSLEYSTMSVHSSHTRKIMFLKPVCLATTKEVKKNPTADSLKIKVNK